MNNVSRFAKPAALLGAAVLSGLLSMAPAGAAELPDFSSLVQAFSPLVVYLVMYTPLAAPVT